MNYVLFHENCMDGFAAAYAAWKEFGDQAQYIPVNYNQPFPDLNLDAHSDIYILDFSYPRDILVGVFNNQYRKGNTLLVLDHHKTAQKDLEGLTFARFDMNKSGAVMAWEYFFPDESVPELIQYVQDRDLWKWELPDSKEISAYLQVIIDFSSLKNAFNIFGFLADTPKTILRDRGSLILSYQNQLIQRILKTKHLKRLFLPEELEGQKYWDIWSVNSPILQSEIGNELAKDYGMGNVYYSIGDKVRHSLRSVNSIDVSMIAKAFGGGGHKNAAGFEV